MAVITIDGKKLEVPDNKNVLECALDAGIYIPHLCHHKDLNPLGSCRMCIVEVNGQDGVMASCTLEAKDGMVITTKSQKLDQLRRLALELLLAGFSIWALPFLSSSISFCNLPINLFNRSISLSFSTNIP